MIKLVYHLLFFFYHTITSLTRFIKWNKLFLVLNFLVNIKVCSMHKVKNERLQFKDKTYMPYEPRVSVCLLNRRVLNKVHTYTTNGLEMDNVNLTPNCNAIWRYCSSYKAHRRQGIGCLIAAGLA